STAEAGQARTFAAVVGLGAALWAATAGRRRARRSLLLGALALDLCGAAISALASSLAVLALGQSLIGAGSAIVVAASVTAGPESSRGQSSGLQAAGS